MPRHTPFFPRVAAANTGLHYKEWAGYLAACSFDRHSEREYFAFRHTAGLLDVTPLYKLDVTGPDAARALSRIWCRDVSGLSVGRVVYSAMADERGQCLDDGTVARLTPDLYRMTSSEPWLRWLLRHGRGLDFQVRDTTDTIAALALQGPLSRAVLDSIVAFDLDRMMFFRARNTTLAGIPVVISRTGYTGDLGYEIWCDNDHALAVWDAIVAAGVPFGLEPAGLDALDVTRIEAGFVLQGVDYITAKACLIEDRKSTPHEAGLGWTVDLDREPFVGQAAIRAELAAGSEWGLVGIEVDWPAIEALYDEYGLPPHLAPVASRAALPLYDRGGSKQVGQATSTTWSPILKRSLGIGQVYAPYAEIGTELMIEHTVEFRRRQLPCRVVEKPFFDPERKKSTPGRGAEAP